MKLSHILYPLTAAGFVLMSANIWLLVPTAAAADETCASCGEEVSVSGDFAHRKDDASVTIEGAANNAAAFREEINGTNFTVTIAHLPAGKYTIVIGEVETLASAPGERLFDVTSGDVALAKNFDIVATAGGARKVCYITGAVEHEDDSIKGPLTVVFYGEQGRREVQHVRGEKCLGRVGRRVQCLGVGGRFFRRRHAHTGNQRAADLARSVAAVAGARE